MWLKFSFVAYVILASLFFALIFVGLGGWWTVVNIIGLIWNIYLAYDIFAKNPEIKQWTQSAAFITVTNVTAFSLWMINLWIQENPVMVTIAIVFSLYHGYIFTSAFGEWSAERRNKKM